MTARRHRVCWLAAWCLVTQSAVLADDRSVLPIPAMVSLPGGCVEIGTLLMESQGNTPRNVCIEAFDISSHEISIGEFKAFLVSTGLPVTHPSLEVLAHELPVVNVTWFEAMAYTRWLSEMTGESWSLPDEQQWEYAAGAALGPGTQYSWGDRLVPDMANCRDCRTEGPASSVMPVGSFPPDSSGLYDMHGNADEWTLSCFHDHDERVERRILGHRLGTCRHISVRGGSYRNTANRLRIWQRASQDSTLGDDDIGFRVVRLPADKDF